MASTLRIDPISVTPDRWVDRGLEILIEVADSMSSAQNVGRALNRLAWLALGATGADRCAILVKDESHPGILIPKAGASRAGDLALLWERFSRMDPIELGTELRESLGASRSRRAIEHVAESVVIPDVWKREWGSKSVAFAPLRAGGQLFGLLAVEYVTTTHAFSTHEMKLLDAIASAAGVALRSSSLVDRLQRAVTIERRLSECTAALRSDRPLPEILDLIADRFVSLLPEVSCAIVVVSPDRTTLKPVAFRGIPPSGDVKIEDLPQSEVQRFNEIWAIDPRRPILVPDVHAHPGWTQFVPKEIGTGLLLPLPEGGIIRGIIAVGRSTRPFTEEEVRVASAFADNAALAIAQARLTEALHLRLKLLEALYRLGDTVVRTSDLKSVVVALNRAIGSEIGLECVRLSFGDARTADLLRVPVADNRERELLRRWRKEGAGIVTIDDKVAACVTLQHRPAGVLWVSGGAIDAKRHELIKAMANGIGEVAYKAKLRRMAETRSQQLAIAADRERIARDLHDTVGQTLYAIGLKLQDILWEVDDPALAERIGKVRSLAAEGVADVRSAVYSLSFLHVRDRGFVPSLRALARQFKLVTGVNAQLRIVGPIPPLSPEVESALYRTAHEALVNVERHARATGIVLGLTVLRNAIELTVRDDGVGLGQRDGQDWRSAAHFGMRSMAKSVEEIGGTFKVQQAQPRGLVIRAIVPLSRELAAVT